MISKLFELNIEILKQDKLENLINLYQKADNCLITEIYKLYENFETIERNKIESLEENLAKYRMALVSFTKINTAFYHKYLNEDIIKTKELIYTYVESSSLHISNLQNLYISSLMFDINEFYNNLLHAKTKESIKQGELLLVSSKRASRFALVTFIIALLLSLVPLANDLFFTKSPEEMIMNYSKSLDSLRFNIQNLKAENIFQTENLVNQNRTLTLKLDSVLKKTGVSKKSNNLLKSSSIKSTEK